MVSSEDTRRMPCDYPDARIHTVEVHVLVGSIIGGGSLGVVVAIGKVADVDAMF